jgi:hypothetical protein
MILIGSPICSMSMTGSNLARLVSEEAEVEKKHLAVKQTRRILRIRF